MWYCFLPFWFYQTDIFPNIYERECLDPPPPPKVEEPLWNHHLLQMGSLITLGVHPFFDVHICW